jgi:hypothetical protein
MARGLKGCGVGEVKNLTARRGCTHIIAEVENGDLLSLPPQLRALADRVGGSVMPVLFSTQESSSSSSSSPRAPQLRLGPGEPSVPLPSGRPVTMQVMGHACALSGGPVVLSSAPDVLQCDPASLVVSMPCTLAEACVLRRVSVQLRLSSPMRETYSLIVRHGDMLGRNIAWKPAAEGAPPLDAAEDVIDGGSCTIDVQVDLPPFPGLVHFELIDGETSTMGACNSVVLTSSAGVASELRRVQSSQAGVQRRAADLAQPEARHPFLMDFALWTGSAITRERRCLELLSSGSSLRGSSLEGRGPGRLRSLEVQQDLHVAHGLLQFCLMTRLPACVEAISDLLCSAYGVSPSELLLGAPRLWLGQVDSSRPPSPVTPRDDSPPASDQLPLLHSACRYGQLKVITALLGWARRHHVEVDWHAEGPKQITPMHLLCAHANRTQLLAALQIPPELILHEEAPSSPPAAQNTPSQERAPVAAAAPASAPSKPAPVAPAPLSAHTFSRVPRVHAPFSRLWAGIVVVKCIAGSVRGIQQGHGECAFFSPRCSEGWRLALLCQASWVISHTSHPPLSTDPSSSLPPPLLVSQAQASSSAWLSGGYPTSASSATSPPSARSRPLAHPPPAACWPLPPRWTSGCCCTSTARCW